MREKIHTIPVNEAFSSQDECPFCYLERAAEEHVINYTIGPGASYMEPEVRADTDAEGFCREHLKKMYDYGNALGCALILQTYYQAMMQGLEEELRNYELPEKKPLFRRKGSVKPENPLDAWLQTRENSCFVCSRIEYNMDRYYATFFTLLKEAEFREKVVSCKGFCLRHFRQLMERSSEQLPNAQREWFFSAVFSLMQENLVRVKGDLDWFVAKNDYRNAGADWKNARDALARAMQKYQGLHPADPPYKNADYGIKRTK